ncbi:MAG TPA: PEGA domain-containing protein [Polyangiaceae bacterium]
MTAEFLRHLGPLQRSLNLATAAVLLTATLHATPTPTSSARDQAVVHFNEGNEAFRRGDTHQAYKQYKTAWELHRTFDIACNLGRAEAELGKLTQAASHLAYCLDHFSSSPQQDLQAARRRYAELFATVRTQVSSLRLEVAQDGAEVFVNGTSIGTTPLEQDVFVLPGTQLVELELDGYQRVRREIPASAGEKRRLELQLVPLPEVSAAAPLRAHQNGSSTSRGDVPSHGVSARSIALVSGAVLTAAGAGVGLGFYLQGAKLDDEASVLRERIESESAPNPNPCADAAAAACGQLNATIDRRDRAWTISTVGFVGMGVFGLGTLATWLWWPTAPTESSRTQASTTLVPVLSGHQLGAAISGTL